LGFYGSLRWFLRFAVQLVVIAYFVGLDGGCCGQHNMIKRTRASTFRILVRLVEKSAAFSDQLQANRIAS
jgi:hypothetical protein